MSLFSDPSIPRHYASVEACAIHEQLEPDHERRYSDQHRWTEAPYIQCYYLNGDGRPNSVCTRPKFSVAETDLGIFYTGSRNTLRS